MVGDPRVLLFEALDHSLVALAVLLEFGNLDREPLDLNLSLINGLGSMKKSKVEHRLKTVGRTVY